MSKITIAMIAVAVAVALVVLYVGFDVTAAQFRCMSCPGRS